MLGGFVLFIFTCFHFLTVQAAVTFDDTRFDNDRLAKGIFNITDLSPVSVAPYLVDKKTLDLLKKIQPYAVELSATERELSGSGVIVGWNSKNQPIVLTAGHLISYKQMDLAGVREISLDQPRGDERGSVTDEKTHVIFPEGYKNKPETALGWYGLPMFHPAYTVDETVVLRELSYNFGYYLMTGRTVQLPAVNIPDLDSLYSVKQSLAQGLEAPPVGPVKTNSVLWGAQVVVMGRAEFLSETGEESARGIPQRNTKMSYSLGYVWSKDQMQQLSDKYHLELTSQKHFMINGEFDKQMAGAGVFNERGELVGIVVKFIRNKHQQHRYAGAIALKIEHVFEQTQNLTQQSELRNSVDKLRTRSTVRSCTRFFTF